MEEFTGQDGESFVEWFCNETFFDDYVFKNPKYYRGKLEKELCDVLVLFEDVVVIFEVKTATTLRKQPGVEEEKIRSWVNKKVLQAHAQIQGARSAIKKRLVKVVGNDRRGQVPIGDPDSLRYFGVAVVDHPDWTRCGPEPETSDDMMIIELSFGQLRELLTELSTVGDVVDYLTWRHETRGTVFHNGSSELDVVAIFVQRQDIARDLRQIDFAVVEDGLWDQYRSSRHRRERLHLDLESQVIDRIASDLHRARPMEQILQGKEEVGGEPWQDYVKILDELGKLRRYPRRVLGQRIHEKSRLCVKTGRPRYFMCKLGEHPMMVFLVSDEVRTERSAHLVGLCEVVAMNHPNESILGIAINSHQSKAGSVDAIWGTANEVIQSLSDERKLEIAEIQSRVFTREKAFSRQDQWEQTSAGRARRLAEQSSPEMKGSKSQKRHNQKKYKRRRGRSR